MSQATALDTLSGKTGTHFDLAKQVEAIGYEVRIDSENNKRSEIVLQDCVVGEIIGDEEAAIKVMTRELKVGDRVQGGKGDDYDTGIINSIEDGMAVVAWDSHVVTPCPVELLKKA